jgi:hypothetical protein
MAVEDDLHIDAAVAPWIKASITLSSCSPTISPIRNRQSLIERCAR